MLPPKTSKILTHAIYLSLLIVIFLFALVKKIEADEKTLEIQELTKQIGKQQELLEMRSVSYNDEIEKLKFQLSRLQRN